MKRLVEGKLGRAVRMAEEYRERGLSMNDLVQEANIALLLTAQEYKGEILTASRRNASEG